MKINNNVYFRNVNAIFLVLPNVFIVSCGIAKGVGGIIRGSVMERYLTTNDYHQEKTHHWVVHTQFFDHLQFYLIWMNEFI